MEEAADTLRELGVEPLMTSATVKQQREMGQIGSQQSVRGVLNKDRATMLGAISAVARSALMRTVVLAPPQAMRSTLSPQRPIAPG